MADPVIVLGLRTFKIWNDSGKGRDTHIEVNGREVSDAINRIEISAAVEGLVKIELDLPIVEQAVTSEDKPARLFIHEPTRDLLIKWGWTPPAEGGA